MNSRIVRSRDMSSLLNGHEDGLSLIVNFTHPEDIYSLSRTSRVFQQATNQAIQTALNRFLVHPFFTFHRNPLESRRIYQIDPESPPLQQVIKCISILAEFKGQIIDESDLFPICQFEAQYQQYRNKCFEMFEKQLLEIHQTSHMKPIHIENLSGLIKKLPSLGKRQRENIFLAAVQTNCWEIVQAMKNLDIDMNAPILEFDETALHHACIHGYVELARILISLPNIDLDKLAEDNYTLLHSAASGFRPAEILRLFIPFLNASNLNIQSRRGLAAVHHATLRKSSEALKVLLDAGANINIQDDFRQTALHLAVKEENPSLAIIQTLLDAGADPNIQDEEGSTALHIVMNKYDLDSIKSLLNVSTDPNFQDPTNFTASHIDLETENMQIIKALLAKKNINPNLPNREGLTPLHKAIEIGTSLFLDVAEHLPENLLDCYEQTWGNYIEIFKTLLTMNGMNIHTVLQWTLTADLTPLTAILLEEENINPNTHLLPGVTAVHLAIENEDQDLILRFIEKGIDFHQQLSRERKTPLDMAAEEGLIEIVKILLNTLIKVDTEVFPSHQKKEWIHNSLELAKLNRDAALSCESFVERCKEIIEILSEAESQLPA